MPLGEPGREDSGRNSTWGIDKIIYPLFTGYSPTCLPFLPEYLPYLVRLLPEDIRERGPRNEKGVLFLR